MIALQSDNTLTYSGGHEVAHTIPFPGGVGQSWTKPPCQADTRTDFLCPAFPHFRPRGCAPSLNGEMMRSQCGPQCGPRDHESTSSTAMVRIWKHEMLAAATANNGQFTACSSHFRSDVPRKEKNMVDAKESTFQSRPLPSGRPSVQRLHDQRTICHPKGGAPPAWRFSCGRGGGVVGRPARTLSCASTRQTMLILTLVLYIVGNIYCLSVGI